MRICILTRGDLFPTDHGAAVKIVRTAEALSRIHGVCCVVTDDREAYLRFEHGRHRRVAYPAKTRAAEEWPMVSRAGRWAERVLGRLGYPIEEHFLYRPMLDPAWWMRAVAVGELEDIDVFQAEFPGYGVAALMAARFSDGALASVVQHNVEWDRLAEFGHDVEYIKRIEQWVLEQVDEGGDLLRVRVAQVEDLELRAELARRDDAVDDVRDVREVALQLRPVRVAELGDALPAEDGRAAGQIAQTAPTALDMSDPANDPGIRLNLPSRNLNRG